MQNQRYSNEQIKQLFFIVLICFLGWLLFKNLQEFLPSFLGAITIYILVRKPFFYATQKLQWHKSLTATLFLVASLLVIIIPLTILVEMLTSKATVVVSNKSALIEGLQEIAKQVKSYTNFDIFSKETLAKLQNTGTSILPKIFGATFNVISVLGIMFFMLFFMLTSGKHMERLFYNNIPLQAQNKLLISKEIKSMVISNAIGIPVIAILQSIIAVIGYFIFGVKEPMFWFVITCFTAMIPVVGSIIVWLPLAVQLLISGQQWQGIGLIIWGLVAVGVADNVFRIILSKKIGDTHPLITIFGVVIGVKLFGFIGLIFGPLLITLFLLLLKIYGYEYFIDPKKSNSNIE
jgi:predicted PurR-regulated permease PerM